MDVLLSQKLLDTLMFSITLSSVVMASIQKFKSLPFIKKDWHVFFINFIISFTIGIPFTYTFYEKDLITSLWISLFSFIEAPGIYKFLKSQNIINYTPKSLNEDNEIKIDKKNYIDR